METFKLEKTGVKNWWVLLILGILLLLAGIFTTVYPSPTLLFLTAFFSVSFLVLGVVELIFALSNTHSSNWGWYLVGGLLDLFIGIILLKSDLITQMAILAFFIGFWLLFKGVNLIGYSCHLQQLKIKNWGWLLALGICELLLSLIIILFPPAGLATLLIWLSLCLLMLGIYYIGFSLSIKNVKQTF